MLTRRTRHGARAALTIVTLTVVALGITGCGGSSVADEEPWFCGLQGVDHADTVRLMTRRMTDRSPSAARRVLQTDDWRGCWGNASLLLGAQGAALDPVVFADRVEDLAAGRVSNLSVLQVDAVLAGYGLALRSESDPARIERVIADLVERSAPEWWLERDRGGSIEERHKRAGIRARGALFGLAWSGTRAAEQALVALREHPRLYADETGQRLLSDLIRRNRERIGQPPAAR